MKPVKMIEAVQEATTVAYAEDEMTQNISVDGYSDIVKKLKHECRIKVLCSEVDLQDTTQVYGMPLIDFRDKLETLRNRKRIFVAVMNDIRSKPIAVNV